MPMVKIFNLDDSNYKNVVCILNEGEHVVGRGAVLQCSDKRVSRKHALVSVNANSVLLTSVHINPCFYKASHGTSIKILTKDSSVELEDGDEFALLAESCWFKVKLETTSGDIVNNESYERKLQTEQYFKENEIINNSDQVSSPVKRNLNSEQAASEPKRLKLSYNESTSSPNKKLDGETSQIHDFTSIKDDIKDNDEDKIDGVLNNEDEKAGEINVTNIKEEVSTYSNDLEEEINNQLIFTKEEVLAYPNNPEEENVCKNLNVIKQEVSLSSNEEEINDHNNTTPIKTETKEEKIDEDVESFNVDSIKKEDETVKDENDAETRAATFVQENEGASTSTNDANQPKLKRERCWYMANCYRKNPGHRAAVSHPGDVDYDTDPNDDRMDCPFGAACYRKNLIHRRQYKHFGRPAPKPSGVDGGTKKRKKKTPKASQDDTLGDGDTTNGRPVRKAAKKKTKKDGDEDSEDDYDYDDPFLDDGTSDEFQLSADSEESTDWEDSEKVDEESQETKRLLKEAKRFTKKK